MAGSCGGHEGRRKETEQTRAPLVEALQSYLGQGRISFHTPGHKGGGWPGSTPESRRCLERIVGERATRLDQTELPGLGNLHRGVGPDDPIWQAQKLLAAAYGADRSFFLVNGSTVGLQALVMATCRPGDKLVISRNVHSSVIGGLILSGAFPVYLESYLDELPGGRDESLHRLGEKGVGTGLNPQKASRGYRVMRSTPPAPTPEMVKKALKAHPEAKGVFITSPTYQGLVPRVAEIARVAHGHGVPLLVDEAWGAHLPFHPALPRPALALGADACVQSAHKTLPALTQGSWLHLKGERIDPGAVEAALSLLQTTSPSYLLMVGLDLARQQVVTGGRRYLARLLSLLGPAREKVKAMEGLELLEEEQARARGYADLDPTRLWVDTGGLRCNGVKAAGFLREEFNLEVEFADPTGFLVLITMADDQVSVSSLVSALAALAARFRGHGQTGEGLLPGSPVESGLSYIFACLRPEIVLTPREAFMGTTEVVPLQRAVGRVAAEVVAPYPPGVPLLCPGERITREVVVELENLKRWEIPFHGPVDPTLDYIQTVRFLG